MRVALFGGTGFVGRYLVDALLAAEHEPVLLVRDGSEAKVTQPGQCQTVTGDVVSGVGIAATVRDCDAVIFCVGILREIPSRGITFESLQYDAVVKVCAAAKSAGISRFLLMSANGVKVPGTRYQETKFRAEEYVRTAGFDATVFRPSVIFGDPDGAMEFATQLYRDLVRPPLPAPGFHAGWRPSRGQVLMSPVHVEDVAAAFVAALTNSRTSGATLTLGGPDTLAWPEMLQRVAMAAGKRKWIVPVPVPAMRLAAMLLDWLPIFPVTRDQMTMLAEGNCATAAELEDLTGTAARQFTPESLAYLAQTV